MKRFSILTTGTKGTPRYFMVDHKNTSELFWDFVAKRKKDLPLLLLRVS